MSSLLSTSTPCTITCFVDDYILNKDHESVAETCNGTISLPNLEKILGENLLTDLGSNTSAMTNIKSALFSHGFTAAPASNTLQHLLNSVPEDELPKLGLGFAACTGLLPTKLLNNPLLSSSIAALVHESITQLKLVLSPDACVLGILEGTYRSKTNGIKWLHDDEHRTTLHHFQKSLFPSSRAFYMDLINQSSADQSTAIFARYELLVLKMKKIAPLLRLPKSLTIDDNQNGLETLDLLQFTKNIISAIDVYHYQCELDNTLLENEIILDVVNVWIPRARKRLLVLPFQYRDDNGVTSSTFQPFQPGDTRPTLKEITSVGHQNNLESFSKGISLMFFSINVLHQVLEGEEIELCNQGSAETRYLTLTLRKDTHQYCLRRDSCLSTFRQRRIAKETKM